MPRHQLIEKRVDGILYIAAGPEHERGSNRMILSFICISVPWTGQDLGGVPFAGPR